MHNERTMRIKVLVPSVAARLVLAVLFALGAGCTAQAPQITIEGQYANLSPMLIGVGSVFMKIENGGGKDALVRATVDIPGAVVEMHDVQDGRMVKVDRISIRSHGTVELKPRALHIMIFKMPKEIKIGSAVTLTLVFEKTGELQVPVKFAPAAQPVDMSGHQH